jgi:hypothetical protein
MSFEQLNRNPEAEAIKSANEEKYQQFLADLEKAGVRFEPARKFELGEINYDFFTNISPEELQEMKEIFGWLREFLVMPYQLDNFDVDHNARRAWETEIEKKYGVNFEALIGRSKLSGGNLTPINYNLDWLLRTVAITSKSPEYKELGERLNQIWAQYDRTLNRGYDKLDIAGKKKIVERLEDKVYEILKFAEEFTNKK